MLQLLPDWKVTLEWPDKPRVQFYIADQFSYNVLRRLAEIRFEPQPTKITVEPKSNLEQYTAVKGE